MMRATSALTPTIMVTVLAMMYVPCVTAVDGGVWTVGDAIGRTLTEIHMFGTGVGYVAGNNDSVGPVVYETKDAGKSWTQLPGTFPQHDLLFGMAVGPGQEIVTSSIHGEQYSHDVGSTWSISSGGVISTCLRLEGTSNAFMAVGSNLTGAQVVGRSTDGGASFTQLEVPTPYPLRYGVFPSPKYWMVTAGSWPTPTHDDTIPVDDDDLDDDVAPSTKVSDPALKGTEFGAAIYKSTDGGASWDTVLDDPKHEFYFNGMDCHPTQSSICCAVGEADKPSATPGARVHCTYDSGSTWNRTLWVPNESPFSWALNDIRFGPGSDVWAVGASFNGSKPRAWFAHSPDLGHSWDPYEYPFVKGHIGFSLSAPTTSLIAATLVDSITKTASVALWSQT